MKMPRSEAAGLSVFLTDWTPACAGPSTIHFR